jgi:hypothetical protein
VVLPLGTTNLQIGSKLINEPAQGSGSPTCGGLLASIKGRYVPRSGSRLARTGRARPGGPKPLRPSVTPTALDHDWTRGDAHVDLNTRLLDALTDIERHLFATYPTPDRGSDSFREAASRARQARV